jgi:hypothetical protein
MYPLALISLVVVIFDHFYSLFYEAIKVGGTSNISALAVEMCFFLICAGFVTIVYLGYYKKKYRSRMKQNPKIQQKLDYEFRTLDG